MTIKEIIAELPKLTQAEKRELRRALDRELAFGPMGPKDAERVRTPKGTTVAKPSAPEYFPLAYWVKLVDSALWRRGYGVGPW